MKHPIQVLGSRCVYYCIKIVVSLKDVSLSYTKYGISIREGASTVRSAAVVLLTVLIQESFCAVLLQTRESRYCALRIDLHTFVFAYYYLEINTSYEEMHITYIFTHN
jgi:hypothetical protein